MIINIVRAENDLIVENEAENIRDNILNEFQKSNLDIQISNKVIKKSDIYILILKELEDVELIKNIEHIKKNIKFNIIVTSTLKVKYVETLLVYSEKIYYKNFLDKMLYEVSKMIETTKK